MKDNTIDKHCPHLVKEWDFKKNFPLLPSEVTTGSHKKVWWKGVCGHEWQAVVKNRVNGSGCPICSGNQLLRGTNDLATVKPELIVDWSEKNEPLHPDMVLPCCNRVVWWKCVMGHEWTARISDRFYGSGCPYCEGHKVYHGFNDLESLYPELAAEWSEKNMPRKAENVSPRSRENVWWKCRVCGYEWKAVISSRVDGQACPVCEGRKVQAGINDLATTDPGKLKEWDYKRNRNCLPNTVSRYSLRYVWWIGICGHHWRARIVDRIIDRESCHICVKGFKKVFPNMLVRLYAYRAGLKVIINEEDLIGIPLTNYLPEKNTVIEISDPLYNNGPGYRREVVKTVLCHKSKIKLLRIIKKKDKEFPGCVNITRMDSSDESLADAVVKAFQIIKITVEYNIQEDKRILYKQYQEEQRRKNMSG